MNRKLEGNTARLQYSGADALGEHEMMAVAGAEIASCLGDPDDRLAGLQLVQRQAEVHVTLEIERRHVGVRRIVEPFAGAKASGCGGLFV